VRAERPTREGVFPGAMYHLTMAGLTERANATPVASDAEAAGREREVAPSEREVLLLSLVSCVLFVSVIVLSKDYFSLVDNFGDNMAYMNVARAIRHWDFAGLWVKHFWGLPYVMALVSMVARVSDRASLLLVSVAASLLSGALAWRLWGGWVAGLFVILNLDWMQRSFLGGSEPLFVAFLFAAFLAARRERWPLAAFLASWATIVRPLGIFALLGIGLVLLYRRDFRRLAMAVGIGAVIGILHALPLALHFGDPLATVHSYEIPQAGGGGLFGFPFYAIIKGTIDFPAPWTNLVLTFGWIFFVVIAVVIMARSAEFRAYARDHAVETVFLIPYLWCLFSYNYGFWARGNFPRFAIPIVPFVLLAWLRWIPKDRRVLWAVASVSPVLAACSAIGVRNVWSAVHRLL